MFLAASPIGASTLAGHQEKPFAGAPQSAAIQVDASISDTSAHAVTGLSRNRQGAVGGMRTVALSPDKTPASTPFFAPNRKIQA